MEAVAAAASVAGIVALSGECLNAILKIRNFYSGVTRASKDIDSFIRKIDSLSKVLEGVKEICASIESTEPSSRPSFNIAGLQIQVEDCAKDLNRWLKIGQKLHPTKWPEGPERGTAATFRKFKAAADKSSVKSMQEQLVSSERGINSCLAVIGRSDSSSTFRDDWLTCRQAARSTEFADSPENRLEDHHHSKYFRTGPQPRGKHDKTRHGCS